MCETHQSYLCSRDDIRELGYSNAHGNRHRHRAALSSMNQHSACVTFQLSYDTSVLPECDSLLFHTSQSGYSTKWILVVLNRFGWIERRRRAVSGLESEELPLLTGINIIK